MKFKTNLAPDSVLAIKNKLQERFPNTALQVELDNAEKILHVHGLPENDLQAAIVEDAIRQTGFEGSWLTRGEENK